MKLHEYQAKRLFASVGIPVPRGQAAMTADEAAAAYVALRAHCLPAPRAAGQALGAGQGPFTCNIKAQLHAGGRGKAGGILTADSPQDARAKAASLLGRRLVTKQTGADGLPVSAVLVDERLDVAEECYAAVTIDRFFASPVMLVSRRGGVDIEDVAASDPAAIVRERLDIANGLSDDGACRLVAALGWRGAQAAAARTILKAMCKLFSSSDASLVEINPVVMTKDGRVLALDAKVTLDDNALFRHPDLSRLRDQSQEHPIEYKASQIGISYVGLSGTIGCLVNGAGLAMATNDIIKLAGGEPANFLDVGGGANVEQVTSAFSIILSDPRVKAILVNIFGGIMRCDWIAQGLLNATRTLNVTVPIVVRLQGTNVEEGRRLLAEAKGLSLISIDELFAAAQKAVQLADA